MQIAINAQLLNTESSYRGAGVSVYCQNLLRALGQRAGGHSITAFVNDPAYTAAGIALRRTRWPTHRPAVRIVWEQTALPVALKQEAVDLVHGLVNVLPLATDVPGVVTVHDLSFLRLPERFPPAKRLYLTKLCRLSVHKARRVIAVSRQTADDLVHGFDLDARKIDVVYNGVAEQFAPASAHAVEEFRRRCGLPERFLLYVGTLEPRKNVERLLAAYAGWRARTGAENRDVALVCVGGRGWFYEQIFQLVHSLHLTDMVHFPGFVPAPDLPDWYRAALAFVYPSLFEGFGLPVLEAMACGTPVLCSRAPSLLEVAGEAALAVAAENTEDLMQGLARLVEEEALRRDLRQRGLARARRFSWARCAAETVAVYGQ